MNSKAVDMQGLSEEFFICRKHGAYPISRTFLRMLETILNDRSMVSGMFYGAVSGLFDSAYFLEDVGLSMDMTSLVAASKDK